ncbi:MAG: Holliday junction branch migration protein RuvA [Deltaproteobacteria bacterium]|nr:Holliday junction branch migration protein RuvA [Candidatus Anaeroferrophillacea bacterium]
MIARLRGVLIRKDTDQVIVDAGGVGYRLWISAATHRQLPAVGDEVALWVTTRFRDEEIMLFGFWQPVEQEMFSRLLKVSGVGPRLALGILSQIEIPQLENHLVNQDAAMLARLPGVGKKLSQRMVIELGEELRKRGVSVAVPDAAGGAATVRGEVLAAMEALGYRQVDCLPTVARVLAQRPGDAVEQVIKDVLRGMHGGSAAGRSAGE